MRQLKTTPEDLLKLAEDAGVADNYLFVTTFDRYQTQLKVLDKLKETIADAPVVVKKSYSQGKENIYTNPAITEYNRTTDSANKTVSTLMRIIRSFGDTSKDEADPLMDILNE